MSDRKAQCPAGYAKQNGNNYCTKIAQPSGPSIIEQSIPGFSGLTSSAVSIINNLLSGGASTGPSQNAAAKYGVKTGMPGSGVSNAFGYDLNNKRGDEMRQRGVDDLLKLVTGYSGTVNATPGELLNKDTAYQNLAESRRQSDIQNRQAQEAIDNSPGSPRSIAARNRENERFMQEQWWRPRNTN